MRIMIASSPCGGGRPRPLFSLSPRLCGGGRPRPSSPLARWRDHQQPARSRRSCILREYALGDDEIFAARDLEVHRVARNGADVVAESRREAGFVRGVVAAREDVAQDGGAKAL